MQTKNTAMLTNARDFCKTRLTPIAKQLDEAGRFPQEFLSEMGQAGFLGINYPAEYGGKDCDALTAYKVIEEFGKVSAGVALTVHVHWMVADIILKYGSDEQKQKYLPSLLKGEKVGAFCVSEFQAGSDAAAIRAAAKKTDRGWIAEGPKWFCTNGGLADIYLIGFKTDPEAGAKGISMFIVEKGTPGFTIGEPEGKMGCRSSVTTGLNFNDCVLGEGTLIGKVNEGFKVAMYALIAGRLGMAAMGLGIAEAALAAAAGYANKRTAFGKPLTALFSVQEMLADMHVKIEGARLLVYDAAAKRSNGKDYSLEGSVAKLFVAETVNVTCHKALQIFGGHGYMKYYDIERIARDGRLIDIGVGASEVLKMVVGGAVAKLKGGE
ncbi:acyl-CoA dehydrogenase family protein [Sporomusa termitida]|uniref:Acyl-CoA dehydrogenase, short-chain specific n=1 Tax=Sporomusa termitida TaxID=2377 RepID=A0A517E1J3_9FIRM|nr:acyl-CoA dehydrogenase family protein [Sporomusa termitida]QDR83470.1 Acyl-CoA dehydrogenase, short-chain specific [Sporomusa termitida]